jgi:hypothetical protein
MKKLLTIGLIASAILTSTLSASNDFAKVKASEGRDFAGIEKEMINTKGDIQVEVGQFYEKIGIAVSYEKIINVNINETPILTLLKAEGGFNQSNLESRFANASGTNYIYPFYFDDYFSKDYSLSRKLAVAVKSELTTFSYENKKTLEDERTEDAIISAGFNWTEPIAFSNVEILIGKGIFGNVDSQVELNYKIDDFTVSAKRTNVDSESYDSISLAYKIKF